MLIANTMAELAAGFLSRKARESAPNTPTTILSLKDLAANTITGCAAESDPASVAAAVSEWEDEALQLLKHKLSWTVLAHLRYDHGHSAVGADLLKRTGDAEEQAYRAGTSADMHLVDVFAEPAFFRREQPLHAHQNLLFRALEPEPQRCAQTLVTDREAFAQAAPVT